MAGKEIVQFYVSDNTGKVNRAERELKGFAKVYLEPGETKTVSAVLDDRAFSYYETKISDWYAFPGEYTVYAAASSRDLRLCGTVAYKTDRTLPMEITMNSTVGDLLENPVTREFGTKITRAMDAFFGLDVPSDAGEEAINDDMGAAIAEAQPLRGVVSFGIMKEEEIAEEIAKYNK